MSTTIEAVDVMGHVIADGHATMETAREAAHAGQWAEAASLLEAWAEQIAAAVETVATELPPVTPEELGSIARTVASAARMHTLAIDAANEAWRRAAVECGARA